MFEQSWKKVYSRTTTKSIPLLQPEHVFCQHNRLGNGQEQDWYPNEKMLVVPIYSSSPMVDLVLKGVWVLNHINKAVGNESISLFCLFKEMLSMQFFWNIRQIILELCRNSKYPIRYLLWWHKILPGAIWTQTYSEPLQAYKMECFAYTVNGLESLADYAKALYLRCLIEGVLNTPILKNKAGVRCAKKTPRRL